MYRLLLSLLFCSCLYSNAQAQLGVSGHYISGQAENWEFTSSDTQQSDISLPGSGWQVGIDYWFRLKNVRIEFLPTLAVSQQEQELSLGSTVLNTELRAYHIFLNTNFYLFDFSGDCDCPTFSKEGPSLQKGLFLQLSPGYSSFNYTLNAEESDNSVETNNSRFSVGLALGVDLGISDLVTLSPLLGLRYYPNAEWDALALNTVFGLPENIGSESSLLQYTAGLRVGFRFD